MKHKKKWEINKCLGMHDDQWICYVGDICLQFAICNMNRNTNKNRNPKVTTCYAICNMNIRSTQPSP